MSFNQSNFYSDKFSNLDFWDFKDRPPKRIDELQVSTILDSYDLDPDEKDEHGRTLLHCAAYQEAPSWVWEDLLELNVDPNEKDNDGYTALGALLILEAGNRGKRFMRGVENEIEVMSLLKEYEYDFNVNTGDRFPPPLLLALDASSAITDGPPDPYLVGSLIDVSDISMTDEMGRTPLMLAAIAFGSKILDAPIDENPEANVLCEMIGAGADWNAQDSQGKTALDFIRKNNPEATDECLDTLKKVIGVDNKADLETEQPTP